jgi:magnesium chelatase family protein
MFSRCYSGTTQGIDAYPIQIESHIENMAPNFIMVGLPDSAVKESKERVIAAMKNSGIPFDFSKRITINFAPADIKKEGSAFDLPIALGLLAATGGIDPDRLNEFVTLGELALDGAIRSVHGVLNVALKVKEMKKDMPSLRGMLLPLENAREGAMVSELEIYPVSSLKEAVNFLNGMTTIERVTVDLERIFHEDASNHLVDFADVKGQETVKRAIEVAAAGGHNVIMIGAPGCGKSMLAKRIPTILPPMTFDEALETTKIHSVAGTLGQGIPLITSRPFRSPHHTISYAALVGGGIGNPRPGEISLAHHGVLFLDELPEFSRNVLEVLRQPLEDGTVTISRSKLSVEYPTNFMLVCAMNPTMGGDFSQEGSATFYNDPASQRYLAKISGPLLDRIDLHIEVPKVKLEELAKKPTGEQSATIRERVIRARTIQLARYKEWNTKNPKQKIYKNADLSSKHVQEICAIGEDGRDLLKRAMTRMGLSARAYDRILKVARTVADLAGDEKITTAHLSEAIQYRNLDRQFMNS